MMPLASISVPDSMRSVPRICAEGWAPGIFTRRPTLVGRTDWSSLSDAFMIATGAPARIRVARRTGTRYNGAHSQSRKPMPTQEVARAARPSALLQREAWRRPVLLDGAGSEAWLSGESLYSDEPAATLEVFASGWGRWRRDGAAVWRWGDPLAQWDAFIACGRAELGGAADGAGVLTLLGYDLKPWSEAPPRRHAWPPLPLLYCARYDWSYRADRRGGGARIAAARADLLADRLRRHERALAAAVRRAAAPRTCPRATLSRDAYATMI